MLEFIELAVKLLVDKPDEAASAEADEPAAEDSGSDELEAASAEADEPAAEESSDNTGEEE